MEQTITRDVGDSPPPVADRYQVVVNVDVLENNSLTVSVDSDPRLTVFDRMRFLTQAINAEANSIEAEFRA